MKISRLFLFLLFVAAVVVPSYAQEPINLKMSHFCPPEWTVHRDILVPWAKTIESRSNGRITFSFFPFNSLGTATQQYDFTVAGTTDIGISITEYTPGRFPLASVMKLPFLAKDAESASLVLWSLYEKYLHEEFKDVRMLWMFCHAPGQLHTVNKPVRTLEDLKGLRIRVGDQVLARSLELLGAIPVTCPISEGMVLLKEGKVDGIVIPWEAGYRFGVFDICKNHTEINMYVLPFFVVMNTARYMGLPDELRALIDETSGEQMAA
jgi:TRAP-type C4-dicarboxylate transport system substrate-binding protein